MNWRVTVETRAERELRRLPDTVIQRVVDVLESLQDSPYQPGTKKLQGHTGWRLRVGDYRILYEIDSAKREVRVHGVRHRREAYRG